MKIYLDTSVYIAYNDDEFKVETRKLFRRIKTGWFTLCYSAFVVDEIRSETAKRLFSKYAKDGLMLEVTPQIVALARTYIEIGALPKHSKLDALHVAIATFYNLDYLVSWDKKHIVNDLRVHQINSVNLDFGYSLLRVVTPSNLL